MAPRAGAVASWRALPGWVLALIAICCAIELLIVLLTLSGLGDARSLATIYGGFWPQLINGSLLPAYAVQPVVMVVTYGFLHGGFLHLAMNMLSLAVLARELARLIGSARMALIYAVSQVAAAALFAVMAPQSGPMVGASGAIFGLAGALVVVIGVRRRDMGQPMAPLWRAVANLVALNLGLTFLVPSIAWQAHLGGAIAGVVLGAVLIRRR